MIKAIAAVAVIIAISVAIAAYPTMLVLGALHGSDGLSAIPALGFWQTLGVLYLLGVVGQALKGVSGTVNKE